MRLKLVHGLHATEDKANGGKPGRKKSVNKCGQVSSNSADKADHSSGIRFNLISINRKTGGLEDPPGSKF